jgi:hypothetical protein
MDSSNVATPAHGETQPQPQPNEQPQQIEDPKDSTTPTIITPDDGDDQKVYAPPAHIAARFYSNKLAARRKSSAASSRRNSLSSAHSHASSHRRASAGPSSTSVAQHLRRASIIEDRKARLADRAAHVEQVRLRAALAKAVPRGNANTREERTLAAQLAKEKYLAKVAATCAEEVARAKRIAEEVKERKLADEARVRLEMEERHAEAEKRRAEYQRNLQERRARRADSTEKKLAVVEEDSDADEDAGAKETVKKTHLTEDDAARRIQKCWHMYKRIQPLLDFLALDLNSHRTKTSTFEIMTGIVADPAVIGIVTRFLTFFGLQDKEDPNATLNTRTFLSALMIVDHPAEILQHRNGAQEQDLISKASDLMHLFEAAVARLASWNSYTPNPLQLETLSQSYTAYTSAFAAWRLQDSSVLIEGMVASFVELDRIWQTVKDDTRGLVSNDYRDGIRNNQVVLLSRIRKLAGPERADTLIKKAIRESRRGRPRKPPVAEVRPRVIDPAVPQPAATVEETAEEIIDPQPTAPARDDVGLLLSKLFSVMPQNRILTHELAIDKDFKLQDVHAEQRAQLYASIVSNMKAGFEAGQGAGWTLSIAENVRGKLLKMTRPSKGMQRTISEALDLEDIHRQCTQGIFSYDGFFEFMADLLPKLCAPFRDQAVRELAASLRDNSNSSLENMVMKLFNLLVMIDKLNLDYTNFIIMNAAPTLIREAAGYEQRQFARDLETGAISLQNTSRMWLQASSKLNAEATRRDPDGVNNPADRPSPYKIHTQALIHLTFRSSDLTRSTCPETLSMDFVRLCSLRTTAIRIATLGAILLTTKNLLKRDVRSHWKHEAARLWQLMLASPDLNEAETPDSPSPAQKAFSILETAHNMPPATKVAVAGQIGRFFASAAAAMPSPRRQDVLLAPNTSSSDEEPTSTSPPAAPQFNDSPVLKLLYHRLIEHISSRLSATTDAEHVRAASSASERLAASGMAESAEQVKGVVETLEAVRRVDWEAHGAWYGGIGEES